MPEWIGGYSAAIAVVAIAVIGGLVKFIYWTADVNGKTKALTDNAEKDRGSVKEGLGKLDTIIHECMQEIRDDIKKIFLRLPTPVAQSASPTVLTDYGKKNAEAFGASAWAEDIAPQITGRIAGMAAFEVDEFCQTYVTNDLDATHTSNVARVAYEFGIERQKVLNVLRIALRDELLKMKA